MSVRVAGLTLASPVLVASGCGGTGRELSAYAPAFAPLLPEGKSLQEVVARAYHAIIPAVARGVGRELLASERRAALADAQALGETMGHCIPGEAATDWEALLLSAAQ